QAALKNTVVVDGEGGANVSCSVTGSGSFNVSAEARQNTAPLRVLSISIPSIAPGVSKTQPVAGTVSFADSDTAGNAYVSDSTAPCNFYFVNSQQTVAAGRVWVSFNCPTVLNGADKCAIGESYALFEDCEGGAEEE